MVFKKKQKEFNCPGCNAIVKDAVDAKFCQSCGYDLYTANTFGLPEEPQDFLGPKPINKPAIIKPIEPEPEPNVQVEIRECLVCRGNGYYGIPIQTK